MTRVEREHQAEAFLDYRAKHPERPWEDLFRFWADGKDFELRDELGIRTLVFASLLSGESVSTDPYDYLGAEPAA